MADLEHPPAPTCCMCHFALCGGASALALPLPLAALELCGPNCLIVGANELITCHLTLIGSRISFQWAL